MEDSIQTAAFCRFFYPPILIYIFAFLFALVWAKPSGCAEEKKAVQNDWQKYSQQFSGDSPQVSEQRKQVFELMQKFPLDDAQQEEVDAIDSTGILLQDSVVRSMPTEKDGIVLGEIKKGASLALNGRSKDGIYYRANYFDQDGFIKVAEVLSSKDLSADPNRFSPNTPRQTGFFAELVPFSLPNPGVKPILYETEFRLGWGLAKNLRTFITGTSIITPAKVFGAGIGAEFRDCWKGMFFVDIGVVPYARTEISFISGKRVYFFDFNLSNAIGVALGNYFILKLQLWSSIYGIFLSKAPMRENFVPKLVLEIHV